MLTSRASLGVFAAATGASAGELHHFVAAIEMAPGPIGLAIAAVLLLKAAFDAQAEASKDAAEAVAQHLEMLKNFRNFKEGKRETEDEKQTGAMAKDNANLRTKRLELEGSAAHGVSNAMKFSMNPALMLAGFIGAWATDYSKQIGELKSAEERNKKTWSDFKGEKGSGDLKEVLHSGGGDHTQTIGQRMGVFQVEHGANEIELLKQIAQNTAKGAADTVPVSNFQ